jgi:hypothetical protein
VQGGNAGYSVDVFNRQLHPEEKVLAKELAQKSNGKYTAEQIEAQMRGTAVTRSGVTEQGIPDTVVGGIPGVDSGGTWVYAGTTPDGKPIITQQLAPEDIDLKAYIAKNTQGQAGIVYPTVTLPPPKATAPEKLPPAPTGTTRVTTVVDGVAYYPLVANCPAAACLNGDPVANAIPDPGTQAYLDAVDRKVDRTVNIVSGVLGVGGAILRGGSAVGGLLAETSGAARVAENVAGAKGVGAVADSIYTLPGKAIGQFDMVTNPGPLAGMTGAPAANFAGGKYTAVTLTDDLTLYRGGDSTGKALGQWFTIEAPSSVAQVRIDTAVKSQWIDPVSGQLTGKSPIDVVYTIKIPAGTTIYQGPVGSQGGVYVGGQNMNQIFVPEPWKIPGVQVVGQPKPLK